MAAAQIDCVVAAPSKLIRPGGDRIKTNARDAAHLTRLLGVGEITAVTVAEAEVEAVGDLVRAREDARADLMRVRHRLSKLLLRQGRVYSGGKAWTGVHEAWLRRQRFDDAHTTAAFDHHFDAVLSTTAARDRLDEQIVTVAASPRWTDSVDRLGCLRGISALTGLALSVEIGDWTRFTGASIGDGCWSRRPGTTVLITATRARRCGPRWAKVDPALKARGHAGNRRLHQQWCQFNERKKPHVVANVAVARQLAGWCWSLATLTCTQATKLDRSQPVDGEVGELDLR